jgi:hypothetical protein
MLENAAVQAQERHNNRRMTFPFATPATLCGCGRVAIYAVYEDKQPHCKLCVYDAMDSDEQILVGRI